MRIGIDYSLATGSCRGMGRYVREIVRQFMDKDADNLYFLYTHEPVSFALPDNFIERRIPVRNQIVAEQLFLPMMVRKDALDVLWCPANSFPVFLTRKIRLVVTVHDVIFLTPGIWKNVKCSLYQRIGRLYRKYVLLAGRRRVDSWATVSKYSARDIRQKLGLKKDITVAYNRIDSFYELAQTVVCAPERDDFYFTVSGEAPSKNLSFLIDVFQERLPESRLVIAGVSANAAIRTRRSEHIEFLPQGIEDTELIRYYSRCKAFVFMSLSEGFGIPILEAMVCGAPIVCSNTTSLPEVAGKIGVLVDPRDRAAIQQALSTVNRSVDCEECRRHVQFFLRWSESADIIRELLLARD